MTMKTTIISSGAMPLAPPGAALYAQASGIKAFMQSPWSEELHPAWAPGGSVGGVIMPQFRYTKPSNHSRIRGCRRNPGPRPPASIWRPSHRGVHLKNEARYYRKGLITHDRTEGDRPDPSASQSRH